MEKSEINIDEAGLTEYKIQADVDKISQNSGGTNMERVERKPDLVSQSTKMERDSRFQDTFTVNFENQTQMEKREED